MEKKKVWVVYFSPAGSTRHVAGVIEKQFQALGGEVWVLDLGEYTGTAPRKFHGRWKNPKAATVFLSALRFMCLMQFRRSWNVLPVKKQGVYTFGRSQDAGRSFLDPERAITVDFSEI
ncbi:MAG: hypothetical protein JRF31_06075 [Deltaproteobacteria bacterium]|nr:hypothetical protein [Deltaproteobacteria bacterium]MBW1957606.1 hypothetical protein [Deltaproteobacteria bacterium]MBW2014205.1 hypothetical protein [Deltaproteobacteria bacterium]MBW2088047.1 hypothetical protein [Deltaproteobacteria bacterium]MBW2320406.1 hypothetical protein [Deltaproteobacteria bacterium]